MSKHMFWNLCKNMNYITDKAYYYHPHWPHSQRPHFLLAVTLSNWLLQTFLHTLQLITSQSSIEEYTLFNIYYYSRNSYFTQNFHIITLFTNVTLWPGVVAPNGVISIGQIEQTVWKQMTDVKFWLLYSNTWNRLTVCKKELGLV